MMWDAVILEQEQKELQQQDIIDLQPADFQADAKKKKKKSKGSIEKTNEMNVVAKGIASIKLDSTKNVEDDEGDREDEAEAEASTDPVKKKKSKSKNKKKKAALQQTDPPSIPVKDLFPNGEFPEGEIQQYKDE